MPASAKKFFLLPTKIGYSFGLFAPVVTSVTVAACDGVTCKSGKLAIKTASKK